MACWHDLKNTLERSSAYKCCDYNTTLIDRFNNFVSLNEFNKMSVIYDPYYDLPRVLLKARFHPRYRNYDRVYALPPELYYEEARIFVNTSNNVACLVLHTYNHTKKEVTDIMAKWCSHKHLKFEVYDGKYSWFPDSSNLIIISLPKIEVKVTDEAEKSIWGYKSLVARLTEIHSQILILKDLVSCMEPVTNYIKITGVPYTELISLDETLRKDLFWEVDSHLDYIIRALKCEQEEKE